MTPEASLPFLSSAAAVPATSGKPEERGLSLGVGEFRPAKVSKLGASWVIRGVLCTCRSQRWLAAVQRFCFESAAGTSCGAFVCLGRAHVFDAAGRVLPRDERYR